MALLDAIRALAAFDPPRVLPDADFDVLGDVLVAHGLAPMASYHLENTPLGAGAPEAFRERLLTQYQGVVTDNLTKLVTLRGALKAATEVPVVLLDAAAYVDWLYPHMAWRPVIDLRVAVRANDGRRLVASLEGGFQVLRTGDGGRTAVLSDGKVEVSLQEGLWPGGAEDAPLYERRRPFRAFGPSAARPSPEDALLASVADLGLQGLFSPLVMLVDVRELLRLELDRAYVVERARPLGLSRALHGALALAAHFFPEVADAAAALRPELGLAERVAVDKLVDASRDPARLRHLRGAEAAARLLVAP